MTAIRLRSSVVFLIGMCVTAALPAAAQKKPPKPEPEYWPCQLTLRDAVDQTGNLTDAIASDGQGSYVHGQDGGRVGCRIPIAPGTALDGWLTMWIDATSARYMNYPAQVAAAAYTRQGYAAFQNRGTFDVKSIRDASIIGQTYLMPFRSYVYSSGFNARLMGDSFAPAPADRFALDLRGTSSVFVVPIDNCTWQITSDPVAPLSGGEGATSPRVLRSIESGKGGTWTGTADFTLPFSATVRVIGVKQGCGTP